MTKEQTLFLLKLAGALVLMVASLRATGLQQPQANPPIDSQKRQDTYAIYSKLISSSDALILIEERTVTEAPCVAPGTAPDPILDEVLADYRVKLDTRFTLEREFTLSRPYRLISSAEAQRFLSDALASTPRFVTQPVPANTNPLFPEARQVIRLSPVYFNKDRTVGLVYSASFTTSSDGGGGWRAYQKNARGQWETTGRWKTCGWAMGH
jgi:hypothetical protein